MLCMHTTVELQITPRLTETAYILESPFPNAMEFIVSVNIRLLTIANFLIASDYMTFLR
jgi:hypothetical protein